MDVLTVQNMNYASGYYSNNIRDNQSDEKSPDSDLKAKDQENKTKAVERDVSSKEKKIEEEIKQLKKRDQEVKQHEQAHKAAAGASYVSGPHYDYKVGPDGKRYAVSGSVKIDTSEIPGDPEATIKKARQIKLTALAPAEPSSQDRRVAADAARMEMLATQEMAKQNSGKMKEYKEKEIDAMSSKNNTFEIVSHKFPFSQANLKSEDENIVYENNGKIRRLDSEKNIIDKMV